VNPHKISKCERDNRATALVAKGKHQIKDISLAKACHAHELTENLPQMNTSLQVTRSKSNLNPNRPESGIKRLKTS
jgi:hypothetical protein